MKLIYSIHFICFYSVVTSIYCLQSLGTVTVKIQQGILRGTKSLTDDGKEYFKFLGVPYAKPPVGDLRFMIPQSPESWEGERDATTVNENNIAIQVDPRNGQVLGSEDCLYLNIYTPKLYANDRELLPVMVDIHGGGFILANGILKNEEEPEPLVENGVVLVRFNYRLSIFGFLTLDIPEAAGNMGLKDQIKALEWVQNNIAKFGGDKNKVTIFGQSAGSASVEYHMLSPLSKGLFHNAILQSGSALNHWAINYEPKKLVLKLLKQMGYRGSTSNNRAIYDYLFNISSSILVTAATQVSGDYTSERVFFGFVPCIEKDFKDNTAFLTANPLLLLERGSFNHVPVIKGFCNREGFMTKLSSPKAFNNVALNKTFARHLPHKLSATDFEQFESNFRTAYLHNMSSYNNETIALDYFGDFDFVAGIWVGGKLMANNKVPVYFYQFSYEGTLKLFTSLFGIKTFGAAHTDDIPYVLGTHLSWQTANERDLLVRKRMSKMWSNFAKSSNPSTDETTKNIPDVILPPWLTYKKQSPAYLHIDKDLSIIKTEYEYKKIAVFVKLYKKYKKL